MKRIIMILTNGFNPDVRVYKEAKYLVDNGFQVEILCWDRECEHIDKVEEIINGIHIKRFLIKSKAGTGMKQILHFIKFIKNVKKYLSSIDYNYIHCHDFDGIIVGLFSKKCKNAKIFFDMHEIYSDYSYAKNLFFQTIFKRVLKKSDAIIYVNDEQIKTIDEKYKLVYLPNYPEAEAFMPIKKEIYDKVRINYIGSVRDYDSLKKLAEIKDENLEINIYGIGTAYEQLKTEYANSNIKMHGKYNGLIESGNIYRNTDVLYCVYNPNVKNWRTAYPIKLFEAILTETPIIVADGTIMGEFVKNKKIGETVDYNNIESINQAINKIIDNYTYYTKNIKQISNNYKWENVSKNLDKIYNIHMEGL